MAGSLCDPYFVHTGYLSQTGWELELGFDSES